jgi:hypothetical protein
MNDLQPYTQPYQFPTSLPKRNGLTPFQKQQREIDFEQHPAFRNRRIVTIVVVALCVGLFVAHILTHGINAVALVASIIGALVAFGCRNYSIPKQ